MPSPADVCQEEAAAGNEVSSASVTNEDIVEEAWEVVNESFIGDAGHRAWSPEKWLVSFLFGSTSHLFARS